MEAVEGEEPWRDLVVVGEASVMGNACGGEGFFPDMIAVAMSADDGYIIDVGLRQVLLHLVYKKVYQASWARIIELSW
jgi:hypothetical protein